MIWPLSSGNSPSALRSMSTTRRDRRRRMRGVKRKGNSGSALIESSRLYRKSRRLVQLSVQPVDHSLKNIVDRAHVSTGEKAHRLGIAVLEQQIKILDRHLLVFLAVDEQHRRARPIQQSLRDERQRRHHRAELVESPFAEEIGARVDQIEEIR